MTRKHNLITTRHEIENYRWIAILVILFEPDNQQQGPHRGLTGGKECIHGLLRFLVRSHGWRNSKPPKDWCSHRRRQGPKGSKPKRERRRITSGPIRAFRISLPSNCNIFNKSYHLLVLLPRLLVIARASCRRCCCSNSMSILGSKWRFLSRNEEVKAWILSRSPKGPFDREEDDDKDMASVS